MLSPIISKPKRKENNIIKFPSDLLTEFFQDIHMPAFLHELIWRQAERSMFSSLKNPFTFSYKQTLNFRQKGQFNKTLEKIKLKIAL